MRPSAHVAASSIISIFVWLHFKSAGCAILSFLTGVCIDLDHLLDYYSNYDFTFKMKSIYDTCRRIDLKTLYLIFHSYELAALSWISIYAFGPSDIWKAAAIGYTQHLIFDQVTNPLIAFGYFLTYRAMKGFRKAVLIQNMGE